ncbi:MAG TPA: hypothetical protein VLT86_18815 [Vicinamibacterales bacterium]|nr:hypothetical protein [Vicinamibacterales bacterium]
MSAERLNELELRLVRMECDLAHARGLIDALQREQVRARRSRRMTGVVGVLAVGLAIGLGRSVTMAQGPGQTVRAPFSVVDSSNKVIMMVDGTSASRGIQIWNVQQKIAAQLIAVSSNGTGAVVVRNGRSDDAPGAAMRFVDGDNPEISAKGSDGKTFIELRRESAALSGPLLVNDSTGKPIVKIQAETTVAGPAAVQPVTEPRGVFLLSATGGVASQLSVDSSGNGRVKVSGAKGTAGAEAGLMITKNGSLLALSNPAGRVTADVSSWDGHGVYVPGGQKVAQLGVSATSGGQMWIADPAGSVMVDVDFNGSVGRVRTGPNVTLGGSLIGKRQVP